MSDSRLLNLPSDVLGVALLNVISANDQIPFAKTLSNTCNPLHQFFKPLLDPRAAQQLLTYVVQGNAEKAKKMYIANPRLLFIEATAQEYAAGIDEKGNAVHRVVKASPFRAMAGCGDIWMLKDQALIDALASFTDDASGKSGLMLAKEALEEHFPNGFNYPASTYDFKPLIHAITQDQNLIQTDIPNKTTEALLTEFRNYFMPGTVTSGHFFNANDLIKTLDLYNGNCSLWNSNQRSLFCCQVVGYLERLVTGVDAQTFSQGISNIEIDYNIKRTFRLKNHVTGENITYFPLDIDHWNRLGLSFVVDSYYAGGRKQIVPERAQPRGHKGLCQEKTESLVEFKQRLQQQLHLLSSTDNEPSGCVIA